MRTSKLSPSVRSLLYRARHHVEVGVVGLDDASSSRREQCAADGRPLSVAEHVCVCAPIRRMPLGELDKGQVRVLVRLVALGLHCPEVVPRVRCLAPAAPAVDQRVVHAHVHCHSRPAHVIKQVLCSVHAASFTMRAHQRAVAHSVRHGTRGAHLLEQRLAALHVARVAPRLDECVVRHSVRAQAHSSDAVKDAVGLVRAPHGAVAPGQEVEAHYVGAQPSWTLLLLALAALRWPARSLHPGE
mmetsp:Transcript_5188/g.15823  ORF Transcript_5188/g.15823 Transcript_5188/m.15823 type:complete len:243 (+) Transcript_5188:212-940(+)